MYVTIQFHVLEPDNLLGFSSREAVLAARVREVEAENLLLKHELSRSQDQLMAAITKGKNKQDNDNATMCRTKVIIQKTGKTSEDMLSLILSSIKNNFH